MNEESPTSRRLLWGTALAIAGANALLALVWPTPHGGQPEALYVAGACHQVPLLDPAALRACIEVADPRMTYGLPWHVMSVYAARLLGERWAAQVVLAGVTFWWALIGTGRFAEHLAAEVGAPRRRAALTAMGLLAACPLVPALARQPQLDLFQAGVAAWSLLWLARSEGLRRTRLAAAVGLLLAYSLMVKPTIAFFVVPVAGLVWLLDADSLRERIAGLPGLAWIFGGFVLGFLGYRLDSGAWDDSRMTGSSVRGDPLEFPFFGIYSDLPDAMFRNLWYFMRMLLNYQTGLLLAVLAMAAAAGALWAAGRGQHRARLGSLLAVTAFLGGYAFHTWLAYKKYYYTVPALPGLMSLTAVFIWSSARGRVGRPLRVLVAVACVLMVGRQQLGLPGPNELLPPLLRFQVGFNEPRAFTPEPDRTRYHLERDIPILLALARVGNDQPEPEEGEESVAPAKRVRLLLALLPLGPKMEVLGNRPDVHGFRHAWMYELHRRDVEVGRIVPEKDFERRGRLQAFFVYAGPGEEPAVPTPDEMLRRCRSARGKKTAEPTEKRAGGECEAVAEWWSSMYGGMVLVTSGPHGEQGKRGLVLVSPTEPDRPSIPEVLTDAAQIADVMGPVFPF